MKRGGGRNETQQHEETKFTYEAITRSGIQSHVNTSAQTKRKPNCCPRRGGGGSREPPRPNRAAPAPTRARERTR